MASVLPSRIAPFGAVTVTPTRQTSTALELHLSITSKPRLYAWLLLELVRRGQEHVRRRLGVGGPR
jgi:hypothetical protein